MAPAAVVVPLGNVTFQLFVESQASQKLRSFVPHPMTWTTNILSTVAGVVSALCAVHLVLHTRRNAEQQYLLDQQDVGEVPREEQVALDQLNRVQRSGTGSSLQQQQKIEIRE